MGWVKDLHGEKVAVDTAPFIYFIEKKPGYVDMLHPFFQAVDRGQISIVTSMITLLEVLVHPLRMGNTALAQEYREMLFNTRGITTRLMSLEVAEEAARLRSSYNVRTPDSIPMATAITAKASFFLTNDIKLPSLPNLPLLALDTLRAEPYS